VARALRDFGGIATVERIGAADGRVHLRAMPRNGAALGSDLAVFMREKAIAVDEYFIERGSLDDVFRRITTSEEGAGHA
jgi:ABC-2 type transport system ATP-binding protein